LFHLSSHFKDVPGRKGGGEEFANPFRRLGQFVHRDERGKKSEPALLHLPPKLLRGLLKLVVEIAAQHGSIQI
jgi:hypothetical protein